MIKINITLGRRLGLTANGHGDVPPSAAVGALIAGLGAALEGGEVTLAANHAKISAPASRANRAYFNFTAKTLAIIAGEFPQSIYVTAQAAERSIHERNS